MDESSTLDVKHALPETGGLDALVDALIPLLEESAWERWTQGAFGRWAHAAFELQFDACAPYRAFCEGRGVTPASVSRWEEIPAVPAAAFKHFDLSVGAPSGGEGRGDHSLVFRTSGTTRGAALRGRHHVRRPDVYRASLAGPFRRALLCDLADPVPFVSLIPPPSEAPDSSLSFMVGAAVDRFASQAHWLVDGAGGWRAAEAERLMDEARTPGDDAPVLVLGTALSFAHLVERAAAEPEAAEVRALASLPAGSRAMETGGFKGSGRSIGRADLYGGIETITGIPASRIVNEYGMTELLSQLYEPVLAEGAGAAGVHVAPPWLRVRALDPVTLDPVPEGAEGVLAFHDLANLGSICGVLTEDIGSVENGRVRLKGRATGAEPRGCSRALDELMTAASGG